MENSKELGNEAAISVLLKNAESGIIQSKDVSEMLRSVRTALESVNEKDHIYSKTDFDKIVAPTVK